MSSPAARRPVRRTEFPSDFSWGTATSSYQIEGAVAEDGRGPSIWDTFSHTPGKVQNADTGDVACDHYHRWSEDLDLMRGLGLNAYRFSVAWPRVLPEGRGAVNARGLDFYERLVDGALARGLSPRLTLYHWDLPQRLQDEGGWASRDTALAFVDYAEAVARRLGDRVQSWATHNEAFCAAFLGHLFGKHAPGLTDPDTAMVASHHLLLSHGLAVRALRAALPGAAQLGIVNNPAPIHPASDAPEDLAAARGVDGLRNRWFHDPLFGRGYPADVLATHGSPRLSAAIRPGDLEVIAAPLDFLGVNYYNRHVVQHAPGPRGAHFLRPEGEYTALGWEVYPDGLREILVRLHRDYRPASLFVAENGAYFEDVPGADGGVQDEDRRRYLESHIGACRDALAEGVPLTGYFAWTLVDNFEWAEGFSARFGVVRMERPGADRVVKASGAWLRGFLRGAAEAP